MDTDLKLIAIPELVEPIDLEDVVSFADFVLSQLVINAPAIIESSLGILSNEENVEWDLSTHNDGKSASSIVANCSRRQFRHIIARIGHHFMDDQLYGGFTMRNLQYGKQRAMCFLYIGNSSDTGYWIRAYSRRENS